MMITFKQGLLVLTAIGFHAHGASYLRDDFSKADRKCIQTIIGYVFKDSTFLRSAFTHSSAENPHFEALEALGDRMINAVVASGISIGLISTAKEFHDAVVLKIITSHFADRFERLGLSRFLTFNSTADGATVRADALEALVGAIKLDWEGAYPHLVGTGRVFKVLTPVVSKLVLEDIFVMPVVSPVIRTTPLMAAGGGSSARTEKVTIVLTVNHTDGRSFRKKASGSDIVAAKNIAIIALWKDLGLKPMKKGLMKIASFDAECLAKGYTPLITPS